MALTNKHPASLPMGANGLLFAAAGSMTRRMPFSTLPWRPSGHHTRLRRRLKRLRDDARAGAGKLWLGRACED